MDVLDNRLAIFLAAACGQTYNQFADPEGGFVLPAGYTCTTEFSGRPLAGGKERFGFVMESDRAVVVAFRGTDTKADWISDLIARQTKFGYVPGAGNTHLGFTQIYDSTRDQILRVLKETSPEKTLLVTGHSLGGGLATLCGLDLANNSKFRQPPVVYSYAAPRVGDPTFAAAYNRALGQSRRIYNAFDLVPHVPPQVYKLPKSEKLYRYLHVRASYKLSFQNMSVSDNHSLGQYFNALSQLDPAFGRSLCRHNPGYCPPSV